MPRNRQGVCAASDAAFFIAMVLASATRCDAEALIASVDLAQTSVLTIDLETLEPSRLADVYRVSVTNPNAAPVTSLQLELAGPWLNDFGILLLHASPDLPTLLGYPVAETYFVYPGDAPAAPLAVNAIDTDELLSASYTLSGDQALIGAGETAVVAVLSVAAGTDPVPGLLPVFGRAVVDGVFECVGYPGDCFPLVQHPEPSALLLACVAVSALLRRP